MQVPRKSIYAVFFWVLFILDCSYSLWQFYQISLDGDVAALALPGPFFKQVMSDPFGLSAAFHHKQYTGTNRFFAQFMFAAWMNHVPVLLQKWTDPVQSIYLACGIAKLFLQVSLIILIWQYVKLLRGQSVKFVHVALLACPLFQTAGYFHSMGIISSAVSYAFFYALPSLLIGWYFLPILRSVRQNRAIVSYKLILLAALAPILNLHGPLLPGLFLLILLVVSLKYILPRLRQMRGTNSGLAAQLWPLETQTLLVRQLLLLFIWIGLWSFYSLYIGKYNIESNVFQISILERYQRLPLGIADMIFKKLGPGLLLIFALIQYFILRKQRLTSQLNSWMNWAGLAALLWVVLLPLGGFREYRPLIFRADSAQPLLLLLFFCYTLMSIQMMQAASRSFRNIGFAMATIVFVVFTLADGEIVDTNKCEKAILYKLMSTKEKVTTLPSDCMVMSWQPLQKEPVSEEVVGMLRKWNIVNDSLTWSYE
jgi:hypothetical protein